jgi:hypothetical protein
MRIDVHQHLWTESLLAALAQRTTPPFARGATIHTPGEAPVTIDLDGERPAARRALLARDGVDRAIIAISSPIGIEALPRAQAVPLIDAYLDGVLAAGDPFMTWGPIALDGMEPRDVDAVCDRGAVGVSMPAGALASAAGVGAAMAVLERICAREVPLFVHPGPGLADAPPDPGPGEPPWWPAMTRYVSQMQSAWLATETCARAQLPSLRVVYAMLGGCAPLLGERLAARSATERAPSPLSFYDCSSFGAIAIDAMAAAVGITQLLYGTDRPVIEPARHGRERQLAEHGAWLG